MFCLKGVFVRRIEGSSPGLHAQEVSPSPFSPVFHLRAKMLASAAVRNGSRAVRIDVLIGSLRLGFLTRRERVSLVVRQTNVSVLSTLRSSTRIVSFSETCVYLSLL